MVHKSTGCPKRTKQLSSTRLTAWELQDRYPVTAISGKCAESCLHSAFRIQSSFLLCIGFSNCLNGALLSLVFDCLFEVL